LANTLSAKKRNRQNEKLRQRNKAIRTRARNYVKRARQAIESGDMDDATEAVRQAASELDRAATKGVIHENNAARRKGRLMQALAKAETQA